MLDRVALSPAETPPTPVHGTTPTAAAAVAAAVVVRIAYSEYNAQTGDVRGQQLAPRMIKKAPVLLVGFPWFAFR